MAYPVDPTNPLSPLDTQEAREGAEELRALKALILSLVVASVAAPGVRQTVSAASRDASGYNNAITTGVGLRPGLSATTTHYQLTYANGFSGGKPLDASEEIVADVVDILGVDLPASNTSYIYKNYGSTYGSCLVPPQEGYAFDQTQASLLHFEEAVTPLCAFGNTYTITGATLTATKPAYGAKSLDCSGGAGTNLNVKRTETTSIKSLGGDSWEFSAVAWFDVQPNAGIRHTLWSALNDAGFGVYLGWEETGGNRRAYLILSSNGTSNDITGVVAGVTNLAIGGWIRFRMQFDALSGNYRVWVAQGGAAAAPVWVAETLEITIASTAKICAITRFIIGCEWSGAAYTNGISGWVDEVRFIRAATKTNLLTPGIAPDTYPLAIDAQSINYMDVLGKKMYQVTAASVAAAANPILTSVTRLFLGEADTSGAAVTVVRNYAIQGKTKLQQAFVVTNTTTSFNHNLGSLIQAKIQPKAKVRTEAYYQIVGIVGSEIPIYNTGGDSTTPRGGSNIANSRNSLKIINDNLSGMKFGNQGGSHITFSSTTADIIIECERGW